jgi:integrase
MMRQSLNVRSWEAAQKIVRDWEAGGSPEDEVKVGEACDAFIRDCEARNLSDGTVRKYKLWVGEMKDVFSGLNVGSLDIRDLRTYRESWKLSPGSAVKKVGGIRTFFGFCQESGWVKSNPAKLLKLPVVRNPAIPFSPEQMEKILWATEIYPDNPRGRKAQVRAFVLVLRYTGLRIGDAVSLKRASINDGKLHLRTAKTGTAVWLPLKKEAIEALEKIGGIGDFFFWTGAGTLKSAISSWHRSMKALFKLAAVRGHCHQFRHYFSVDLLSHGVPIEDVAVLLGHQNSAITARYYNAFVKSRQESLERNIERAWRLT